MPIVDKSLAGHIGKKSESLTRMERAMMRAWVASTPLQPARMLMLLVVNVGNSKR